jgi:transposase
MERSEVSDILDVSYQSTCRFAKQNGSKSRKKYRAPNSKLNDEHMISLMELIEDNAGLTQRKLREHLKNKFNLKVSQPAISNTLKKLDITWKAAKAIPPNWNSIEVVEARAKFCKQIFCHIGKELIYVDESSFNLGIRNSRGYAKKGQPALISCSIRTNSLTLIDSLSSDRGQLYSLLDNEKGANNNNFNNEKFNNYLLRLSTKIDNFNSTVIFFDNSNVHTNISTEVESVFQNKGIQYVYLPPYSPFLNPIEHYFNKVKTEVKAKTAANMSELVSYIKTAQKNAGTFDLANSWFKHVSRYYQPCISLQNFKGNILNPDTTINNNVDNL